MSEQTAVETVATTPEVVETPPETAVETKEAPKETSQEHVSGKLGTLLRREQQLQSKIKAQKESLAAEREALQREKAEIESLKAKYAKVKEDPIAALKETGLSYEELTRKILNSDTPEGKIEALAQKLEAMEREKAEYAEAQRQREILAQREANKNEFKEHIFSNEEKYPTLTLYDPEEVREAAWSLAVQYYNATKIEPDVDDVCQLLEKQASQKLQAIQERMGKRTAPAKPQGAPKTLSNAKAAERAVVNLPPDYNKMSPDEQRKFDAEFLAKHLWKD